MRLFNRLSRRPLHRVSGALLPAVAALAAFGAAPASAPSKAALQSERIAHQIDALLGHRLAPQPLPATLPNPFAVVVSGGVSRGGTPENAAAPLDSAAALSRYIGGLKVGGVMRMNGQVIQVVINDVARKEGDIISVRQDDIPLKILVLRITPTDFVLRLNDAEQSVKY